MFYTLKRRFCFAPRLFLFPLNVKSNDTLKWVLINEKNIYILIKFVKFVCVEVSRITNMNMYLKKLQKKKKKYGEKP